MQNENEKKTFDEWAVPYLAGFFDGEGCIHIHNVGIPKGGLNPSYRMGISISSTRIDAAILFTKRFRGSYRQAKLRPRCQPCWLWSASGRVALAALETLLPYLRIKRAEAEVAISFQRQMRFGGHLSKKQLEQREFARISLSRMKGRVNGVTAIIT